MLTGNKRVVGTLLAVTLGITSTAVISGTVEAAGPPIRIHGVVSAAGGGGLAGINVTALAERAVEGATQWVAIDSATTGEDGNYNVGKLPDGNYRVRFDDPTGRYATEYYNNAFVPADAQVIALDSGKFDMAEVVLGGAAQLTGVVTGSTGAGIEGAEVTAYVEQNGAWVPFTTLPTAASGRYDLGLLPGGTYKLGFHDPATGVAEYWNDKTTLVDADVLTVQNAGSSTGLNVQLATPLPDPGPATDPSPTTDPSPSPAPDAGPVAAPSAPSDTLSAPAATPAPSAAAAAQVIMVKRPRIRGVAAVAQVLRVTRGSWNPTKVSRKIQWLANGNRIKGATKNRLRVTKKLRGKRISVRVVAFAPKLTELSVQTRRTKKVRG